MKKYLLLVTICLLSLTTVYASTESYEVIENKILVTIMLENANQTYIQLPYDTSTLESTHNYTIESAKNGKSMLIENGENITIKFIAKSIIEHTGNEYFLIIKNPIAAPSETKVVLPEGALLKANTANAIPRPDSITTDGRKITLEWNESPESIVVVYEFTTASNTALLLIGVVIAILIINIIIKNKMKVKKTKKNKPKNELERRLTQNLIGEERKIIQFLAQKNKHECWTKDISKELNISKVRLSRRLRSLEQKELIQKTPYGNENKIKLKKIIA